MSHSLHAAIIMDGNGRWAQARGWPRTAGHKAGADSVRCIIEAAPSQGIGTLTLYAFSSDNWKRPKLEVQTLLRLFARYMRQEVERCIRNGVRFSVIGRRDRLPAPLVALIEETEHLTRNGSKLWLRVAVDYSAREAIRRGEIGPDVDLLIRTGGEQRLSDFLLWEAAYAELIFTPVAWPDFREDDLAAALQSYHRRERRFGAVPADSAA
jgi:undecaprenyl diphosphate synthase